MLHNVGFLLNNGFSSNPVIVCISEIRLKQALLFLLIQKIFPNQLGNACLADKIGVWCDKRGFRFIDWCC